MASPLQIRAARFLLGWSQKTLARKANVSCNTVGRIESGYALRAATMTALERALVRAGIHFIPADDHHGEGVRLARPDM